MCAQTIDARRIRIDRLGFDYEAQPRKTVAGCNLCAGTVFETVADRDRYGYSARACRCVRCGLIFLNPVMTKEAYAAFYAGTYRPLVSAFHGRIIDAQTIQHEQRAYAAELAEHLGPFLNGMEGRTLLDIGGSTGVVAHELARRFGLQGTVLDPAPLEVAEAKRLRLQTITMLLEDYSARSRYDAVIMCQTVDHLLDVAAALEKVRALLADDGLFYIDIVDFRHACSRANSVRGAVKIDHPYSLTESTMEAYLASTGFPIARKVQATDGLHVGYVCRRGTPQDNWLPAPSDVQEQWRTLRALAAAGGR